MQVEFTENLSVLWCVLFITKMIPPFLTDIFIITVMLHRFEPSVAHLRSFKLGVRPKTKQDSQCESCLLCSLTPARLIRIKQITSDEA